MKKKIAAGIAVSVAAASIATNLLVDADELVHSAEYLNTRTQAVVTETLPVVEITVEEEEEKTRADLLREWIINLPVAVKTLFFLPLWAVGAVPVALGTAVVSAMAPIWAQVVGVLLQSAVLVGAFAGVYKLVFPKKKVKDLFRKKNFRWLLLGAGTVSAANIVLTTAWSGWPLLRAVVMTVVGFGVLCLLWYRICGKLRADAPAKRQTRLQLDY